MREVPFVELQRDVAAFLTRLQVEFPDLIVEVGAAFEVPLTHDQLKITLTMPKA